MVANREMSQSSPVPMKLAILMSGIRLLFQKEYKVQSPPEKPVSPEWI